MNLIPTTCSMLLVAGVIWVAPGMQLMAQDKSTTTVTPGQPIVTTQVERGEVVYVSGNELVVRMDTGEVRSLTVPDNARATVDGKEVTIRDLKPGMKLQRTITTTQSPRQVTTVRTVNGTVFAINAPYTLVLSFPDGSPNKQYRIPKDQVFMVDGRPTTAFELRRGTPITATVVTTGEEILLAERRATTGTAPPPPPAKPATPPPQPILLIEAPAPAPVPVAAAPIPPPRQAAPAEPPPTQLPKTASPLPLLGLLGLALCGASLGLRAIRRR